jgi:sulfite reductase (NADPH) hemoprotein beta-component
VICSAHPGQSAAHQQVHAYAAKISELLMPKTRAYYEIWLDQEMLAEKKEDDPLYQDRYLPRKFKIAIAIPPNNDIDVFANDIGLIAIIENGSLKGFNIAIGGGLSTTHGSTSTYARLATEIGFLAGEENVLRAIYAIVTIQRDFGNRSDRKLARLKYTIDNHGLGWFKEEVERRMGLALDPVKPYAFTSRKDYYGWKENDPGLWYYTVFAENGRVLDDEKLKLKSALLEVAKTGKSNFRFTANQNLILADIRKKDKAAIDQILRDFGIIKYMSELSSIRKSSMACVALNTCPLALAEGQRYLPSLIGKIELLLVKYNLSQEDMIIRMTGCPNGCGRPNLAEIGFVGTAHGHYNLHLGSDETGTRLNKIFKENLDEPAILKELDSLFASFQKERNTSERFGDFTLRMKYIS